MTNLDYIIETFEDHVYRKALSLPCYLCEKRLKITGVSSINYCDKLKCIDCVKDSLIWLKKPYKPKIKLKQFEYDLLKAFNETSQFRSIPALKLMHNKGYYGGIKNLDDTIKHILDTAEIV